MKNQKIGALLALALGCVANAALAGGGTGAKSNIDPWLNVVVVDGTTTVGADQLGSNNTPNASDTFAFSGNESGSLYSLSWDLTMNPDPFIDGTITLTNLTAAAKDFTVNLSLPGLTAFSPGVMNGSIDATVYDLDNSGSATLQNQSSLSNIYFGTIDGSTALNLYAVTLTCSGTPGCNANSSDSDSGLPVAGVNNKIGTQLKFNLSAGDKVVFHTHFEVTPVPVPPALPLLGSALLGLAGLWRRRGVTS